MRNPPPRNNSRVSAEWPCPGLPKSRSKPPSRTESRNAQNLSRRLISHARRSFAPFFLTRLQSHFRCERNWFRPEATIPRLVSEIPPKWAVAQWKDFLIIKRNPTKRETVDIVEATNASIDISIKLNCFVVDKAEIRPRISQGSPNVFVVQSVGPLG